MLSVVAKNFTLPNGIQTMAMFDYQTVDRDKGKRQTRQLNICV